MKRKPKQRKGTASFRVLPRRCPDCGGKPVVVKSSYGDFMVMCENAGCKEPRRTTWYRSETLAVEAWNYARTTKARDFLGRRI